MTFLSSAVLLFLVMDPLGNVPVFMALLKNYDATRQRRIILRESLIALLVLVVFAFAGQLILSIFGIDKPALTIAGGIILFLVALNMIFPAKNGTTLTDAPEGEPYIVPLAVPLVAGPSAISVVTLLASSLPERRWECLLALAGAWLATTGILLLSPQLARFLGPRGLSAMEKLMGMLLTAVAVQMFLNGLKTFWSA